MTYIESNLTLLNDNVNRLIDKESYRFVTLLVIIIFYFTLVIILLQCYSCDMKQTIKKRTLNTTNNNITTTHVI